MPDHARHGARPRAARLADVADRAGLSAQTVSNMANDRAGYTEASRQRVLTAMEDLGFQPNATARKLRLRRTMRLGYCLSEEELDFRNPIGITFLRELAVAAAQHGYEAHDDPAAFRDIVAKRTVDGFVLSHSSLVDPHPRTLAELGVPFAAMKRTEPDLPHTWVDIDNFTSTGPLIDVEVLRALYSVPGELIGQRVQARADSRLVKIYCRGQLIKTHPRKPAGGRSTDPGDYPVGQAEYALRDVATLTKKAAAAGLSVGVYAARLLEVPLPPAAIAPPAH